MSNHDRLCLLVLNRKEREMKFIKNNWPELVTITAIIASIISIVSVTSNNVSATEGDQPTEGLSYETVEMIVTAYCPCSKCCGKFADGVTASGRPAEGFIVAAPPEYPFGTWMSIEGYAGGLPVPVLDRGGVIKGNKLDLLFDSHEAALEWGRKTIKVKVWK